MAKYRKRPIVVEAFQWTGSVDQSEDPVWLVNALRDGRAVVQLYPHGCYLDIVTLEGVMRANPGDFVIQVVSGELYPCKSDIFAASYEAIAPTS